MKISIFSILIALFVSACGGGGGSSTTTTSTTPALSFQPLVGAGTSFPVMEIYNQDLNGDGIDEVIIAGRKTQPSTSVNWQNFNIQIFGWNNSTSLANETSTWFSGSDNIIVGTDQAVKFGDFDGDGRIDMITTSATDDTTRSIYGQTIVYHQNAAGAFTKSVVTNQATNLWTHDLVVYDFNNDGRMDFLASDYGNTTTMGFGNADDTFTLHTATGRSASGITFGDFNSTNGNQYGRASVEIVMSDSGTSGTASDDTRLFTWSVVNPSTAGVLTLSNVGSLPTTSAPNDHTIRVLAFDYDGSGSLDIVAFNRQLSNNDTSTIQFFSNDGSGVFTNDPGALSGYGGTNGGANYQPTLISIDGTGASDIFLSGVDFDGTIDQTMVLVNNNDGTFTTSYVSNFTTNWDNKKNATVDAVASGMTQQFTKGPSNNYYIVTTVLYDDSGTRRAAVYTTNLGTTISTGL